MLLPEIERQQLGKEVVFRADAAFAKPEIYEALEERGVMYVICMREECVPKRLAQARFWGGLERNGGQFSTTPSRRHISAKRGKE